EREEAVARGGRVLVLGERVEQVVRERVQDRGGLVRGRGAHGPGRHGGGVYRMLRAFALRPLRAKPAASGISAIETLSSSSPVPRPPSVAARPLPARCS